MFSIIFSNETVRQGQPCNSYLFLQLAGLCILYAIGMFGRSIEAWSSKLRARAGTAVINDRYFLPSGATAHAFRWKGEVS